MLVTPLHLFPNPVFFLVALIDKMWFKCPFLRHWMFIYSSLRILDIALVEMLGYWILGIGSLRILVIATLKTEQYSASGANLLFLLYVFYFNHVKGELLD